jgi:hypothetical protein
MEGLKIWLVGTTTSPITKHLAATANPASTTVPMFILPKDIHGWWMLVLYLVASVLSSAAVVCSGWCTIKFIRSGWMQM